MGADSSLIKIPIGVSACLLGQRPNAASINTVEMADFFKKQPSGPEKRGFRGIAEDYRRGLMPLALVKSLAGCFEQSYLAAQTYLDPDPRQLMLRSLV